MVWLTHWVTYALSSLQFEEENEYVEILSNVDLHVEMSIRIMLKGTGLYEFANNYHG